MKIKIENKLDYLNSIDATSMLNEFNEIIKLSLIASGFDTLRSMLFAFANINGLSHFEYGFGGDHCWISKLNNERVLLITKD